MQRVVACTVTMCDDVNVYYLDQWRSSDSSTDVNIMIHNFREGHMTLLTHALHRAPSVSLETWSGELQYLFDRAVTRHCWTQHATTIVNNDIAREDAVRFRHLTAAHGRARLRDALSGACGKTRPFSRTVVGVAARCEWSCSQLCFERSERVVSSQTTTSTPGVVMGPKTAQKKLLMNRFTSRTPPASG